MMTVTSPWSGEELVNLMAAAAGKPRSDGRLSSAQARTLSGTTVPLDAASDAITGGAQLAFTIRQPRGVVAAITPFNLPLNLVAHKVGPALAAGCATVLKPADRTP